MPDFTHYFCVINKSAGDPNRRFFASAPLAYRELDRREAYGIECEVQHRDEWSRETMQEAVNRWA